MSAGRKVAETPGIRSKPVVPNAVRGLITPLATSVQLLALSARELLLTSLPDAIELPDATAKKIGYGFGTGYKDMVASIILSKKGVKIGIVQSASFPDPASQWHQ
jgi:hypothetical protein